MKRLFLLATLVLSASFSVNAYSQNTPASVEACKRLIETTPYCKSLDNLLRSGTYLYYALENANQPRLADATGLISYNIAAVFEYIADQKSRPALQRLRATQEAVITLFSSVSNLDPTNDDVRVAQNYLLLYSKDFRAFVESSNFYIRYLQSKGK